MRTDQKTFEDIGDVYVLDFKDNDVKIVRRKCEVLYEGPISTLCKADQYFALTVGEAIIAALDTVPAERIGEKCDEYLFENYLFEEPQGR